LALIASTLLIFVPTPLKSTTPIIPNALYELLFWLDGGIVKQTPFNPLDVLAKVGLWLNLGLTAILVTFFLSRLHQRLQQQQLALQEAQLDRQSQQHLLSMSLAAAATAHELSTPLASISLLAAEASDAFHHQETEVAHSSLHQIQRLVGHCKKQISDSLKQHQLERSEQLALMPWTGYVEQLLLQWKTLGPQVNLVFSKQGNHLREPNVINLPILSQSISCLLNNASDASHEPLAVKLSWTIDEVVLCIHNQGEGFPEALLAAFPQPQMSDKTEGHGVGLALAHANISQLGGQLRLFNPAEGGAQACIILPNQIEHWQLRQNVTQQKTSLPS
jgi:two-component system sensor histidine kinase RegB